VLLKADGSEFPGELSASVLKDASGQAVGFIATTRDITERKRAEEEIHQSYQNQAALDVLLRVSLAAGSLQTLLQHSLERLVSLPWLGLEPKGSIFLVEDDPEVLTMKTQHGLTTPSPDACARVPFGYCLCGRAASSGEVQFADRVDERHQIGYQGLSHHGHYCVPILSAGKAMGVIKLDLKEGHRRDKREVDFLKAAAKVLAGAIERKRAEEEVLRRNRELTALHRALISISQTLDLKEVLKEIIFQAGIAVDSAYTNIVLVNHDGSPGMSAEDFVAIPPLSVMARSQGVTRSIVNSGQTTVIDDAEAYEGINPALLEAGIKSYAGTPIKSKDKTIGALFVASKQRNAFRDRVGLLTDFASQAAIAIENARLYEEASTVGALREADRLKTDLLANVSHELRTPLASIKGYCTSMLHFYDRLTDDEKVDWLHEINQASDRLTELVENLLDLSRLQATGFQIDKERTRIEPIITAAVEDIRRNAEEHRFVIRVAKPLPVVEADSRRIRQVIDNLLTNAVKYSPEGTEVSILCEAKGKELVITVRDQGVGITPEEQVRVFERFYQVTLPEGGKSSGAGLGLAICKRIVEAHGGRIWVESAPGQGSTFKFTLPLVAETDNDKGQ
jgi:K+-sensing histidine kinase KdpD